MTSNVQKKVMVFGSFDMLHPGHINFFQQAKRCGNFLIVVVARDATITYIKGRPPMFNEHDRLAAVAACPDVDLAVLGSLDDKLQVIRDHRPDLICLGYDQKHHITEALEAANMPIPVVRLTAHEPERYKSSLLKKG